MIRALVLPLRVAVFAVRRIAFYSRGPVGGGEARLTGSWS